VSASSSTLPGHEIARWLAMTDDERRFFVEHTLPVREAALR